MLCVPLAGAVRAFSTVWQHFNGLGFDEPYLYKRCQKNHVSMSPMSHMTSTSEGPRLSEQTLESSAYGKAARNLQVE